MGRKSPRYTGVGMKFDVELVGKIGSMALIDKKDNMIDYTRVARLSRELKPGISGFPAVQRRSGGWIL